MNDYKGLYRQEFEHDACGIGTIISIDGVKTHKVVTSALTILENLEHRGGVGAEENSGDGAGILLSLPHKFLKRELSKTGVDLGNEGDYAVGAVFLSLDEEKRNYSLELTKKILSENNIEFLAIREVQTNPNILGKAAKEAMPYIAQIFVKKPSDIVSSKEFERKLYIVRRIIEKTVLKDENLNNEPFYFSSFSSKTIVYKGMLSSTQLRSFYLDLKSHSLTSHFAMVHSRFSTNTFPSWERAHPNRMIIHNGEINTVRGNVNKIYSRQKGIVSDVLKEDISKVLPIINKEGSDSAMFDNTLEFLSMNGMDITKAVMMMIPEPWYNSTTMSQTKKAFYEYNATLMEPWDGPAAMVFTDGDKVGAVLDRNGLRPSRYYITKDNHLILSSEVGALEVLEKDIVKKDRLMPGKMLLVDLEKHTLIEDDVLKEHYASEKPYGKWVKEHIVTLGNLKYKESVQSIEEDELLRQQKVFGYGYEDVKNTILNMVENGEEELVAMGIDSPIAVLSNRPQPLFNYFKQLFAQVTNPPIDAIREYIVTSTNQYLGKEGNILVDKAENCNLLKLDTPFLYNEDLLRIKEIDTEGLRAKTISTLFKNEGEGSLLKAVDSICEEAYKAYEDGYNLLILSDRGVNENNIPIPSLLAVSAVHQSLVKASVRSAVDLIVESGEPREIHHFATLLGFGASAINPYLVYETINNLKKSGLIDKTYEEGVYNYNKAALKGIIKIISKMGISTIQSYQGAQIFEAIGLSYEFINKYFKNTVSRINGIGISELEQEAILKHSLGYKNFFYGVNDSLDTFGVDKSRAHMDKHLYNPYTIYKLQRATRENSYELFKEFTSEFIKNENEMHLRSLLDFNFAENPLPLEEVESIESIVKRFKTGAMSYGSISKEAHEALAIAMNRIGGKSNTGEGGEDRERWTNIKPGFSKRSAIKQVASGRFGVTSEYLVNADEIQIKMAQGAKPGEGGQLPGSKVYPWVAKTRNSTTGVGLISPPPHHDIYSIEDLAQLIYDLKNANRKAKISVKLVSEAGVGTVAAGVAKGGAELILISGYDGGTGASPKTSIYHAGLPWELGLAETQQTLLLNNLRERVKIEVDGKLMSGRDLAIAALLGAEEFGFATAPLVTLGCVMMRVCNKDTCPVGIATQNEYLRKKFAGEPEYVVNFMYFMAEELREYMAKLGFKTIDEMVGRVERLKAKEDITTEKAKKLDLGAILYKVDTECGLRYNEDKSYNHKLNKVLDTTYLLKTARENIKSKENLVLDVDITNTDRTLGTILGSEVTKKYKNKGLPKDSITVNCKGSAGQSFGAFLPNGITLKVSGDGNDYVGKGLCGGILSFSKPKEASYIAESNVIIGNVALYGATSGKLFANGIAGERFAVRNSGATTVVEGVGAHGCEYMTGGLVLVLGEVGINFAAGMSGGVAYVYDENRNFRKNVNSELVLVEKPSTEELNTIKALIEEHVDSTGSEKGRRLLKTFERSQSSFLKVIPRDYKKVLEILERYRTMGLKEDDAQLETFNEMKSR